MASLQMRWVWEKPYSAYQWWLSWLKWGSKDLFLLLLHFQHYLTGCMNFTSLLLRYIISVLLERCVDLGNDSQFVPFSLLMLTLCSLQDLERCFIIHTQRGQGVIYARMEEYKFLIECRFHFQESVNCRILHKRLIIRDLIGIHPSFPISTNHSRMYSMRVN